MQLNELKQWKFLKSRQYGSKPIKISKIELDYICNKLNITDDIKYLSSGKFGNAYSIGDKILKITSDQFEAKSAYNLIGINNPNIVKYYGVYRYSNGFFIIIMDKVTTLDNYLKRVKNFDYIYLYDIIDILFYNWGNLDKNIYIKKVLEIYNKDKIKGIYLFLFKGLWDMYKSLEKYGQSDLHIDNIGVRNNNIVFFDISPVKRIHSKFDNIKKI